MRPRRTGAVRPREACGLFPRGYLRTARRRWWRLRSGRLRRSGRRVRGGAAGRERWESGTGGRRAASSEQRAASSEQRAASSEDGRRVDQRKTTVEGKKQDEYCVTAHCVAARCRRSVRHCTVADPNSDAARISRSAALWLIRAAVILVLFLGLLPQPLNSLPRRISGRNRHGYHVTRLRSCTRACAVVQHCTRCAKPRQRRRTLPPSRSEACSSPRQCAVAPTNAPEGLTRILRDARADRHGYRATAHCAALGRGAAAQSATAARNRTAGREGSPVAPQRRSIFVAVALGLHRDLFIQAAESHRRNKCPGRTCTVIA